MQKPLKPAKKGEPVRLAVIGLGMIGKKHAELAAKLDEGKLVAVCDVDENHRQTAKDLNTNFYTDYQEMIHREELNGVVIAVPNDLHVPVGTACAKKGLHLFVEKPITPDTTGADTLIETARKCHVQLLVGHHRRFNASVVAARRIIKEGQLGKLVGVSILYAVFKPPDYFEGPFAWRREKGGGPILINLIHEIDDLRYLCGEITRVHAESSSKTRNFPVEDSVSVSLRFQDGAVGTILFADCVPSLWSYEATTRDNAFFFHSDEDNFCYFLGT
jgi:predicted dehydrogenase